jgi:hypothetical protein
MGIWNLPSKTREAPIETAEIFMSTSLLPDSPNFETEQPESGTHRMLMPPRRRLLVTGWAVGAGIATFGWLYLVARATWSFLGWLL